MNFVLTMRFAVAVLICFCIAPAAANLYRWVDPETGSVKFSSYPPPWFNDAARQRGAPKVEVIPPGRATPTFGSAPGADREAAARPGESANKSVADGDAPHDDRQALLKLLAQRSAALMSSPVEAMGKAYGELVEPLQQLEKLDRQLRSPDPKEEAARLEEKWQIAAPLESHRAVLLQQLSSLNPPPPGSPRDKIESAWAGTQRLLAALGWIDGAIVSIDSRKANSRHFEMNALIDRTAELWEPYVDPGIVRKSRGR